MNAVNGNGGLRVEELTLSYGELVAVDRATFDAHQGAITALVGPSGCGKTSLLRAIAGFETPRSGKVTIAGRCVAGPNEWLPPERRQVGMVFQQGALFPHMTVRQNVGYGVAGRTDADALARAAIELAGLEPLERRYPDQLSGGQQQRVALARALAPKPAVVLFDEPFAALDAAARESLREQVCTILREAKVTAVIVTHDQEEALSLGDRVAVMMHGRLLQCDSPEEIYLRPSTAEVAEFVGGGQLVPCEIRNSRLSSEFGPASCDAVDGPALLLVRPEDLVAVGEGGANARVERRRYYGHDLLYTVRLASDRRVDVRAPAVEAFGSGTTIRLGLRAGRYRLYAANGESAMLGHAIPTDATP